MSRRSVLLGIALALSATVAAGFASDVERFDRELAAALAALFLLLLPFFVLGVASESPRLGRLSVVIGAAALLVPYLLYGWGTGAFRGEALGRLVLFLAVPTCFVLLAGKHPAPSLWDVAAVLAIWLPFDFRLLEGIWTWPEGRGSYGYQAVLAVDLALVLFLLFREVPRLGYRFRLRRRDLRAVLAAFLFVSAAAIPLGLAIDFIEVQDRSFMPLSFLSSFIAILLFIGIPEELLFRGLIQNFLESRWGRNLVSLAVASAVFGAAHLNNGDAPNWSYALMATVAGIFYGLAYRWTGSVFGAALVHALVDAVWRAFFR